MKQKKERLKRMIKEFGKVVLCVKKIWQKFIVSSVQKKMFHRCGSNVRIASNCDFTYENISIGNNVYIGPQNFFISPIASIELGNGVFTGPNVTIVSGNHDIHTLGKYMIDITEKESENYQDVIIEDDVWIGANAIILKGVTIGRGSVIGAGTIISKDVPEYSIISEKKEYRVNSRFDEKDLYKHLKMLNQERGK